MSPNRGNDERRSGDERRDDESPIQALLIRLDDNRRTEFLAAHGRLRESIDELRSDVRDYFTKFELHVKETNLIASRVLVIETQRTSEKEVAMRRGALAGSLAAVGVSAFIQALKGYFKP